QLLGYTSEELIRTAHGLWLGRIHPNDAANVEQAYQMLFTKAKAFNVEYRTRRQDGPRIWVHSRAPATRLHEGELYADGLLSDITQRKRVEDALQQAKEA